MRRTCGDLESVPSNGDNSEETRITEHLARSDPRGGGSYIIMTGPVIRLSSLNRSFLQLIAIAIVPRVI